MSESVCSLCGGSGVFGGPPDNYMQCPDCCPDGDLDDRVDDRDAEVFHD